MNRYGATIIFGMLMLLLLASCNGSSGRIPTISDIEYGRAVITLTRNHAYIPPSSGYSLTIQGDGTVTYRGLSTQTWRISRLDVRMLVDESFRIDFFALPDPDHYFTDIGDTDIRISIAGRDREYSHVEGGPDCLSKLKDEIYKRTDFYKHVTGAE